MSIISSLQRRTGSILGDAFGYQTTLLSYLDYVFSDSNIHGQVLKFFYQQLYRDFAPDINGYTLIFFIPPDLSGYNIKLETTGGSFDGSTLYTQNTKDSYMKRIGRMMTFAAIDFNPPQSQVRADNISSRNGSVPIASEISETDTVSIVFLDNQDLDIYMFHHIWVEYIREILDGVLEPNEKYYKVKDNKSNDEPVDSDFYGAIDYAAACYIVKYRPDMKTVTYAAKCVGIFPQTLPNKELIGTRSSNEIVTLPFSYSCSGFREALHMEIPAGIWIFDELGKLLLEYSSQSDSPLFGGFLGGIINKTIGDTKGMIENLTGNAAKLGGVVGDLRNVGSRISKTTTAISNGDYSSIFTTRSENVVLQ